MDRDAFTRKQRKLDNAFKERGLEYNSGDPLLDGVFDQKKYEASKYRILFISKEPNNPVGTSNYRELSEHDNNIFWAPMKELAYALLKGISDWKKIPLPTENREVDEILFSTALININKFRSGPETNEQLGAGPKTDMQILALQYEKYRDLLEAQIDLLRPDIIICLGTFDIMQKSLVDNSFRSKPKKYRNVYFKKDQVIFDSFFIRHIKVEMQRGSDYSTGISKEDFFNDILLTFEELEETFCPQPQNNP